MISDLLKKVSVNNTEKRHLDHNELDYIISEYLGLSKEYLSLVNIDTIKNDVKYIIDKYGNNNIEYILTADFEVGYASDNFDNITRTYSNIKVLEDVNGIIVYKLI